MKLNELIEILQKIQNENQEKEIEVETTWEGIFRNVNEDNIYFHKDGRLLIDADNNFYKEDFQKGKY